MPEGPSEMRKRGSSGVDKRFCAEESIGVGDPLAGTATHPERNLLISWPRAKWSRSLRQASDMPANVSTLVEDIAANGRRINLIHRQQQDPLRHSVFLMPECRAYEVPREELASFLCAVQQGTSIAPWYTGNVKGSVVLCCTHGKKDKCCAKFGYRTYKAISEEAQRHGSAFDIWESTHLGGCRLAATAMLFPQMRKYGRIEIEDIPPLLQAEASNQPYLRCYRGDSTLTPAEQCAEIAALEWLQARDLKGNLSLEKENKVVLNNRMDIPISWRSAEQEGQLMVSCVETEITRYDTCADFEGKGPTTSKVWRTHSIASV